jgi:hypothetical protein
LGEILHTEGGWGLWVSFCELWGGSCFVLFFDKNSRVYKNVLSFWGFSKNIL